jgi:gluconate 2-dehydrogenase gamma chain
MNFSDLFPVSEFQILLASSFPSNSVIELGSTLSAEVLDFMATNDEPRDPVQSLTSEESEILAAIAERIFPTTETPGAVEIGAVNYIDNALAGDYAALRPLYRQGLRAINRQARAKFGKQFLALNESQQDAVLNDFESGSVDGFKPAAEFFEAVRYHVLEGVFCEPQYGGNKNMTGWRLVDFPGQQFGYPDAYIDKRVDLEPVAIDYRKSRE